MQEWWLWCGFGLAWTLLSFEFNPWLAQAASLVCFSRWAAVNVDVGAVVRSVLIYSTEVFFREVSTRGLRHLPEGPVLLSCGPHANQFIDPIIVLRSTDRLVKFLAAAKSLRRKYIGDLAHALGSIGVERAQDLTIECAGTIHPDGGTELSGQACKFVADVQKGDMIWIGEGPLKGQNAAVLEVGSNTTLTLKSPLPATDGPVKFKKSCPVDSSGMFEEVANELRAGATIGVFPEGGSHDRTSMLPFKAGIAVMALKTLSKHPELPLKIVPVGINYSQPHKFRSRVFVEFGEPFEVPPELLALYLTGERSAKIEAGNQLLAMIEEAHSEVTVQVADPHTRKLLWAIRRLWATASATRSRDRVGRAESQRVRYQSLRVRRAGSDLLSCVPQVLAEGFEHVKDQPRVQQLLAAVDKYERLLRAYGVHDHAVANRMAVETNSEEGIYVNVLPLLIWRSVLVLAWLPICVPGLLLASPCGLLTKIVSARKAAEALKGSNVKLTGRDVIATWKIMIGLVFIPVLHLAYTGLILGWLEAKWAVLYFFFMPFVSAYSIKIFEDFFELVGSLKPLVLMLVSPSQASRLVELRGDLEEMTVEVIKEVGWLSESDMLTPRLRKDDSLEKLR